MEELSNWWQAPEVGQTECKAMKADENAARLRRGIELEVPEHLQVLYLESCGQLRDLDQQRELARLLTKYQDVFS